MSITRRADDPAGIRAGGNAGRILLTVTESGFDHIPLEPRAKAFAANEQGWGMMVKAIGKYVGQKPWPQTPVPPNDSAPLFAARGDAARLRLVIRLCHDGPMSITRLTAGSRVTRQAVTKICT
jgi:hypothetical protein